MKRRIVVAAIMVLAACGPASFQKPSNEQFGDSLGEQANFARKHLSDRGFVVDKNKDKADAYVDSRNLTVEGAKEYATDKGMTKEVTQDKLLATRKFAGEEANRSRKYLYARGIQETRHGDQSTQDRLAATESATEANSTAIEATNVALLTMYKDLKDQLADQSQVVDEFKALVASQFSSTVAYFNAVVAGLGDEISAVVVALVAEEQARVEAVNSAVQTSEEGLSELDLKIDDLEEAFETAIEDLEDDRRRLARQLYSSQRTLHRLSYQVRRLGRQVESIEEYLEEMEFEDEYCTIEREQHPHIPFLTETILHCPEGSVNLGWTGFPL